MCIIWALRVLTCYPYTSRSLSFLLSAKWTILSQPLYILILFIGQCKCLKEELPSKKHYWRKIEGMGQWGRKRNQPLDDLKEKWDTENWKGKHWFALCKELALEGVVDQSQDRLQNEINPQNIFLSDEVSWQQQCCVREIQIQMLILTFASAFSTYIGTL